MADVEVALKDLRVDTIAVAGGRPSAIRVTHLPTGTSVRVGAQPTIEENRDRAMELLLELLTLIE
jgi:protein subunit release factor A